MDLHHVKINHKDKRLEEAEKTFVLITGALSIEKNIS